jgi:hypothetical protein
MFQMGNNTGIEVPADVVTALARAGGHPSWPTSTATNAGRPSHRWAASTYCRSALTGRKESGIQGGDAIADDLQSALSA